MTVSAQTLRDLCSARRDRIRTAHRAGASGFETCIALTAMMDEALQTAFGEGKSTVAVLALGGYGRAELCPHSDIDVMVLCGSGDEKEEAEATARSFLHLLWDAGVDVGHSVRSIDDVLAQWGANIDSWASMLESRFVCGNRTLAASFHAAVEEKAVPDKSGWFIEGVFAELDNRHERYGSSVKLLEPNIKKSAGGLRDLHAPFWLFRGTDRSWLTPLGADRPAMARFVEELGRRGDLDRESAEKGVAALAFLFRTRHEMHFHRESLHDTLEYALQLDVAEALGFGPRAELRSVEIFMRDYYLHTRTVYSLSRRLCQKFREVTDPPRRPTFLSKRIAPFLFLHDGVIGAATGIDRLERPEDLMEVFALSAERDAEIDIRLRAIVERSADVITPDAARSAALAVKFRRILDSRRVALTLQAMNEPGILGRYIPEFGDLVAFFQHNVYHYFTADEHTLIAVARAESLREQHGVMHEVFRNLRRKDLLYLAILLHDIAKPRGVADHEITGVSMAEEILRRMGMEEAIPTVTFLVRHHLVMEQVAFRRNVYEADTIREFSARFERPELLDYLYVLTYADLSAVNINVWTEWKSTILQELYLRTAEVLRRNLRGEAVDEFHQARHVEAVEHVVDALSAAMPREDIQRHLDGIQSAAYLAVFSEDEVRSHIHRTATDQSVQTLFAHSEGYTEVTVIARDAPFALSRCCAVLAANDATIFDANVFTRDDGVIIDRFRVSDATTRLRLDQRVCDKISADLDEVMKGTLDVNHLFEAHKRKWKRRPKLPPNPTVRTEVAFEDNPRYTIIDVFAPDSVGLLYRITEAISRLGLNIYFAKIATRVDGIVDAFYVLNNDGTPVTDSARRATIRAELLHAVRSMREQQLQ